LTIVKINNYRLIQNAGQELATAGIENPNFEAEILLKEALNKGENFLFSHPDAAISNPDYQRFRRYIRRRKTGLPVAYIIGKKEFFGNVFYVNPNVLIPRPESEMIVEIVNKYLESIKKRPITVIDVGTGSGCLIISIARVFEKCHNISYYATDISEKALRVARENAKKYNLGEIKFIKSDLITNQAIPKFDILVANLPYIPKNHPQIEHSALAFEPESALYSGNRGDKLILELVNQIALCDRRPEMIVLEIFEDNAEALRLKINKTLPEYKCQLVNDLSHRPRVIILTK